MSLINKMLQDLEGRRSEGEVIEDMGGQVRAAPELTKIHVAWWIVLGLTFILTGMISWLWGYRTAPAVATEQAPQLALKLAPTIRMPQVSAPVMPAPEQKDGGVPPSAEPSNPVAVQTEAAKDSAMDSQAMRDDAIPPKAYAPAQVREIAVPVPAVASPAHQVKSPVAPTPSSKPSGKSPPAQPANAGFADQPNGKSAKETETAFDIPASVAKQMKEITPQQRAEEEYRRATTLLGQNRTREAIGALEKSLHLDARHSVARQTLAGLLLESKRQDEAVSVLQDGLKEEKNSPALAMMLARLQVNQGDLRPAVETLQRTLPYALDRPDYQAFLAALLQREGRHKEAVEHYAVALRKSPQNGLWWMGIAISMQADNRPADAREAFGRAKVSNDLSPELLAFVEQKLRQLH